MDTGKINNKSAGVIVVRKRNDVLQYLLLRSFQHWDSPKGKIEENETPKMAAIREVKEETGIDDLIFQWGDDSFITEPYSKINKTVEYFVAYTEKPSVHLGTNAELGRPEHNEFRWVSFEDALYFCVPRIQRALQWAHQKIISS